jgi:hypothetical protein
MTVKKQAFDHQKPCEKKEKDDVCMKSSIVVLAGKNNKVLPDMFPG